VTPAALRWLFTFAGCAAVVIASVQASALSFGLAGAACILLALWLAALARPGRPRR
jgi:hypothetical protein